MSKHPLNPAKAAEFIGWPLDEWAGNCYGIACQLVKHKLIPGKAVYGQYCGPIAPTSRFGRFEFHHHGWIIDGDTLVDPTRWVFEDVEPYIFVDTANNTNYDFGSNRLKEVFMLPPPPHAPEQNQYKLPEGPVKAYCQSVFETDDDTLCAQRVGWIASQPLHHLGNLAEPIYRWVAEDVGIPGFIPIDNKMLILGE